MNGFLRTIFASGCRTYHRFVSPLLPRSCRFFPSCAVYAAEAFERHGIVSGAMMTLRRLSRCHPWHPGGYDPVR